MAEAIYYKMTIEAVAERGDRLATLTQHSVASIVLPGQKNQIGGMAHDLIAQCDAAIKGW